LESTVPVLRNPKHEKVAQELAKFKSPVEASQAAGYPPGSSFAANARKRVQRPDIRARVKEIQTISGVVAAADSAYIQRKLIEMTEVPLVPDHVRPSDQLKALELLGKIIDVFAPEKVKATLNLFHDFSPDDQRALADFVEALSAGTEPAGAETAGDSEEEGS
jgi:hypothetical protein